MKGAVAVNILFKTRLEATERMTQNCTFRNTNSVSEITWSWKSYCLRKALFSKCFSSKQKRKAVIFKFLRGLKSVFEKLGFHDGLIWTVNLTVEIKVRFKFQIVVHTGRGNKYRGIEEGGKGGSSSRFMVNETVLSQFTKNKDIMKITVHGELNIYFSFHGK